MHQSPRINILKRKIRNESIFVAFICIFDNYHEFIRAHSSLWFQVTLIIMFFFEILRQKSNSIKIRICPFVIIDSITLNLSAIYYLMYVCLQHLRFLIVSFFSDISKRYDVSQNADQRRNVCKALGFLMFFFYLLKKIQPLPVYENYILRLFVPFSATLWKMLL